MAVKENVRSGVLVEDTDRGQRPQQAVERRFIGSRGRGEIDG